MIIRKSNLKLVPSTDPVLNKIPEDFDFNGDNDPEMVSNIMHERMKELGGIGLSANQVGLDQKIFVMGSGEIKMTVFNPEVLEVSEVRVSLDEGCLSFPGIYMKVARPEWARVRFKNIKNETVEQTLHGLTARIFLHEYDHMMGQTFKSRVSKMKWDLATNRKQKRVKKMAKTAISKLFNEIKEDIKSNQT